MIVILKLKTGENIIGSVEENAFKYSALRITDPMAIERDEDGMKLRDCLMLSADNVWPLNTIDIITYYTPLPTLVDYYIKALTYSKLYTKPLASEQMKYAMQDLEEAIRACEDAESNLTNTLIRASGSSTLQ